MKSFWPGIWLWVVMVMMTGCSVTAVPSPHISQATTTLAAPSSCDNRFVSHELDHITTITGQAVAMFDSNGSGLAVNDLDNDGDLDIVLANLGGDNQIFWNDGAFQFRRESLGQGTSRAAAIVDVDGNGWQDIIFTNRSGGLSYWQNDHGQFTKGALDGVTYPAYAMNWADLDADGDLDLVTGSYDAALEKDFGNDFLFSSGGGVVVYTNDNGRFLPNRLTDAAQALALYLIDLNLDRRLDLMVGNDFAVRDSYWLQTGTGWQPVEPFATTTHSTMSFDAADINNDGQKELLATDMKPYQTDPDTLNAWQPVMEMMMHGELEGDPQVMENVVQAVDGNGRFHNIAPTLGLSATGWSWSAKFGDLDEDGFVDAYVVNGMAASELFGQLPNSELVEENLVFRNLAGQQFALMPAWELNSTAGGRGMSMADLDDDGDLDIIVNNLLAPAQIFENRLCNGSSLLVDLNWPSSANPQAIGAELTLETNNGRYQRTITASSGYLSGDPARVHFGFPPETRLQQLIITWPDGQITTVERLEANTRLTITRP